MSTTPEPEPSLEAQSLEEQARSTYFATLRSRTHDEAIELILALLTRLTAQKDEESNSYRCDERGKLESALAGALKSCIDSHGPITNETIGSAAKRIVGIAKQWRRSEIVALTNELDKERADKLAFYDRIAVNERALADARAEVEELKSRVEFVEEGLPQSEDLEDHYVWAVGELTRRRAYTKPQIARIIGSLRADLATAKAANDGYAQIITDLRTKLAKREIALCEIYDECEGDVDGTPDRSALSGLANIVCMLVPEDLRAVCDSTKEGA